MRIGAIPGRELGPPPPEELRRVDRLAMTGRRSSEFFRELGVLIDVAASDARAIQRRGSGIPSHPNAENATLKRRGVVVHRRSARIVLARSLATQLRWRANNRRAK